MSKYPSLSEADSIIMEILWRDGETSSSAILGEIADTLSWSRQTVRTYLKRLMDKGLVGAKQTTKRVYCYYPIVSKEDYAADKTGSFLNEYYDSLSHMVAGIVKNENVTDADLEELEEMIKKLRRREGR